MYVLGPCVFHHQRVVWGRQLWPHIQHRLIREMFMTRKNRGKRELRAGEGDLSAQREKDTFSMSSRAPDPKRHNLFTFS